MLEVTEKAKAYLAGVLSGKQCDPDVALRFFLCGEDVQIALDSVRPDDIVFQHDGRQILYLDPATAHMLALSRMDLVATHKGERLHVSRIGPADRPPESQGPSCL